jgi:hypothetical protein
MGGSAEALRARGGEGEGARRNGSGARRGSSSGFFSRQAGEMAGGDVSA